MAHGKKAYGEDSFQKTGVRGFCKPLRISRIKKDGRVRKAELPSFLCLYMYFISQLFYISAVTEGAFQNFAGRIFRKRGIKRLGIL